MNARHFWDAVEAHPQLEIVGMDSDPLEVHVARHTSDGTFVIGLSMRSIPANSWKRLEAVLMAREDGIILRHITRVTGYYAYLQNWNRSKLRENEDRHAGQYALPEVAV